jgi:uncharacterized lipoprotein YddW (UPF0748 family)
MVPSVAFMLPRASTLFWRSALALFAVAAVHAQDEVRALWVVRTSMTSPSAIETMVATARSNGFNTLLVQIRGRGDAYYQDGLEPRPITLEATPAFDPLALTIARAHASGLTVHAWMNMNLVSSATDLPSAREHIIYRHPEWLMVPRALGEDLSTIDPHSPEYLGRLARYVRGRPNDLEGLYLSPITQDAADYTTRIVRDVTSRYDVDGIHLDYIRYPSDDFDYSREALSAFQRSLAGTLTPAEGRQYDARLANEPFIYAETFPERWHAFRTLRLTALVTQLRGAVKSSRPSATLSVAVLPDANDALTRRMQDWADWLRRDLVDVVCPMAYTTDSAVFASQVSQAFALAGRHPLWAGIGAFHLSSGEIVANIQAARRVGAGGVVLFSYDSLTDAEHGPQYLAQVDFWK